MRKKKEKPEIELIDFPDHYKVCSADLSLRRPGWCILTIDNKDITAIKLFSLDNKTKKNKTHGQLLNEIHDTFCNEALSLAKDAEQWYFVREKMIMNIKVPSERDVAKVVGIMDFLLGKNEWYEMYPVTVKKIITGNGKAEKSEVASALERYIGKQKYKCDDESDAAAVGIAWLIQQKQLKES